MTKRYCKTTVLWFAINLLVTVAAAYKLSLKSVSNSVQEVLE